MIEPFSTRIPLMIAIGNHEYDHVAGGKGKDPSGVKTDDGFQPTWGNFMVNDSGGECGVPTARRFRMPSSAKSNGVFWYSYNHGIVHTIVISSEHDLSIGSPQYEFLEHDLEHVDRTVTPWVVLESHRPLYEGERGEHWTANTIVAKAMREEIEDLLYVHKVDLVLAGHYHEYHRTCSGLYRGECDSGGPIHITIGKFAVRNMMWHKGTVQKTYSLFRFLKVPQELLWIIFTLQQPPMTNHGPLVFSQECTVTANWKEMRRHCFSHLRGMGILTIHSVAKFWIP
jgi:Calcineurin-like phosphoesterase